MRNRDRSFEFVAHRLNTGDGVHEVLVRRVECLNERALRSPHQNSKNILFVSGRSHGGVITLIDQKGVTMSRHHHAGFAADRIMILSSEAGFGSKAIMI